MSTVKAVVRGASMDYDGQDNIFEIHYVEEQDAVRNEIALVIQAADYQEQDHWIQAIANVMAQPVCLHRLRPLSLFLRAYPSQRLAKRTVQDPVRGFICSYANFNCVSPPFLFPSLFRFRRR